MSGLFDVTPEAASATAPADGYGQGAARTWFVHVMHVAASPITHAMGTEGNESLVNRERVVTPHGIADVPVLSGNSLRHRCVRAPGWRWLVSLMGLEGKLSLETLSFLFHGGSLSKSTQFEDVRRLQDFRRVFPLGALVGGCVPDQALHGSLHCGHGHLACRENTPALAATWPAGWMDGLASLRPAEQCVTAWRGTRGDAAKTHRALAVPHNEGDADSAQMIFGGQAVAKGSVFLQRLVLPHASPLEAGALLWSLALWQASGGTVGGQAARGNGVLASCWRVSEGERELDAQERSLLVARYLAHATAHASEGADCLARCLEGKKPEAKAKAPAKTSAKGRAKAKAAPVACETGEASV